MQTDQIYLEGETLEEPKGYHAVLTRFNVRTMREKVGIFDREGLKAWLAHRIPIFRDICLPSLIAQTVRPDLWLIAFDGEERDLVSEVIALFEGHPWIVPVWVNEIDGQPEDMKHCFAREISARMTDEHRFLITSRIDNDDALGLAFCEHTQAYTRAAFTKRPELEDFWINFPVGAQLAGSSFKLFMHSRHHFLSRSISRRLHDARPDSLVVSHNHAKVHQRGRTVFVPITDRPMWLQTVHGRNASNKRKDMLPDIGPAEELRASFGLREGYSFDPVVISTDPA